MSAISGFINTIRNAVYGEQVRGAIVNALLACYSDVENPDLQSAAFQAAIEAAYQDGILDIIEVTQVSQMTNENIIYRYMGTQAGYMANTLYYHNGTAWVPLGSGVLTASTVAGMTNTDAIYKYTGSESGYLSNALYYYNGTAWVTIDSAQMFTFTDEDEANYSESVTIKKSNNQLYAQISEEKTITPSGGDLDDEAISGYSYRDLFVTNNVISGGGNFENGVPSGFTVNAGTPLITNEQHYGGSYSLKASGTSSQQFVCDLPSSNTDYYVALMANVTDYTKGYFGVQFSSDLGADPAARYCAISQKTNGWEFVSNVIRPDSNKKFWIGSLTQASGTGYIDVAVIVPLPAGVTKSQLDTAYSSYLSILSSEGGTITTQVTKEFKIANRGYLSTSSAEQRRAAFVAAMNKKAEDLGMTNSVFYRADGATSDNKITARDMVKMVIEASAFKDIARVWGKNSYTITTQAGKVINLETTVHESVLEDYYPLIGGKTGTWNSSHTLVAICKVNDYFIAAGIGGAGSDQARFTAMKQLMDICKTILEGGTNAATVQAASYACAAVMPTINAFNYEGYEFSYLYEQDADTQFIPASTTKVLAAITALDHILDVYNLMEIESGDIVAGSGNVFASGDKITFLDCLYAMFLPSSNTAAYALSREIGKRLIYD